MEIVVGKISASFFLHTKKRDIVVKCNFYNFMNVSFCFFIHLIYIPDEHQERLLDASVIMNESTS